MKSDATSAEQFTVCQRNTERQFSRLLRPLPLVLAFRFVYRLRHDGMSSAIRSVATKIAARVHRRVRLRARPGAKFVDSAACALAQGANPLPVVAEPRLVAADQRRHETRPLPPPGAHRPSCSETPVQEVLGLQPGEWVQVKSEADILDTLDPGRRHRGLIFLPEMSRYCGRRFRVFKRVERIFLEESKQIRTLGNTVLLEGIHCAGAGLGCDKACMLYWREAWLSRSSPPGADPEKTSA